MRGHADAVLEADRPVSQHRASPLVGDLVLGSTATPPLGRDHRRAAPTLAGIDELEPVEPRRQPVRERLRRRSAGSAAHELEAVVVDRRAEEAQLRRERQEMRLESRQPGRDRGRRRRCGRARRGAGEGPAQLDLVPRDEVAGRRPRLRPLEVKQIDRCTSPAPSGSAQGSATTTVGSGPDVGDSQRAAPRDVAVDEQLPRARRSSRSVNDWRFEIRARRGRPATATGRYTQATSCIAGCGARSATSTRRRRSCRRAARRRTARRTRSARVPFGSRCGCRGPSTPR